MLSQVILRAILEKIAARTGLKGTHHVGLVAEHGDDHDFGSG